MNRFILTGAPGGGKTAILARIGDGIRTIAEPAREILAEQRAVGGRGTPEQDPELFVRLLLERSIHKHAQAAENTPVLYDRGIPDCAGYAAHLGADPAPSLQASRTHRYHPKVLVLEPWREIYTTDGERQMTYEQSVGFHKELLEGYRRTGYELITVPRGSIEERVAFVRGFIVGIAGEGNSHR